MVASTSDLTVFWLIVFARFLLPLFIPKFPLPAILACFVIDAMDQSIFQTFTDLDLTGYQGYDKALDVFYLSIAMLATLRNWVNYPAVQIARGLFYLRLVGVLAFELTDWRPLLVIFPNTFEYFFMFYEVVRSRWSPGRMSTRYLAGAVAVIWVVLKLPQEYWIHVARLDTTNELKTTVLRAPEDAGWIEAIDQHLLTFVLFMTLAVGVVAVFGMLILRKLRPPKHPLRLAADPLPAAIDEARERDRSIAKRWRLFDFHLLEKVVLVGFITVIFAQILPGVTASPLQLMRGVGVIVTINTVLRLRSARARSSPESAALAFVLLAMTNIVIVAVADWLLRRRAGGLDVEATVFFLMLLSLIVTLYDLYRPVCDERFSRRASRSSARK